MKIFWSWQSDTPGKTGRHFIRDALKNAIDELRQPDEIEEPKERENKKALHLDQDRMGVPGSPDLARTILEKIDASAVFVADVTPVSIVEAGDGRAEKRNMNPNVAIELGYALKTLTDSGLLMVLNKHYGDREFLPFDLAHKAGPIIFDLPPDAERSQIRSEQAALENKFVEALRPYTRSNHSEPAAGDFIRTKATTSPAVYFKERETLSSLGEAEDNDLTDYSFPDDRGFYLRLSPRKGSLQGPINRGEIYAEVRQMHFSAMSQGGTGVCVKNNHGVIVFVPEVNSSSKLIAATQIFPSGEMWGMAQWLLYDLPEGKFIPSADLGRTFGQALTTYVEFMSDKLGIAPPYFMESGVIGLQGFRLAINRRAEDALGPIDENSFVFTQILTGTSIKELEKVQKAFLEKLFEMSNYPMPDMHLWYPNFGAD